MANRILTDLELEANELVLSIDSLGNGYGPAAFESLQRALSADVRPELLRQKWVMDRYVKDLEAKIAGGTPEADAIALMSPQGVKSDEAVIASEERLIGVWRKIVADLLAIGRQAITEDSEAA
jgi:hypothetical protein